MKCSKTGHEDGYAEADADVWEYLREERLGHNASRPTMRSIKCNLPRYLTTHQCHILHPQLLLVIPPWVGLFASNCGQKWVNFTNTHIAERGEHTFDNLSSIHMRTACGVLQLALHYDSISNELTVGLGAAASEQ